MEIEGGRGGGDWVHRRPQVYQLLLLSRVVDVKYSCFTFTFNESVHGWEKFPAK